MVKRDSGIVEKLVAWAAGVRKVLWRWSTTSRVQEVIS